MFRLFRPILAGAGLRDRLFACAGSLIGIALTGWVCALALGPSAALPLLVAPMGASAVLVFAVPASPLAQPWSVIGGNTLSALVGVAVARMVPEAFVAAGLAVGVAILVMSLARCLHPPGGAAALTAVIGGPAVHAAGFGFALVPVGVNAAVLAVTGIAFHRWSGHSYPHRAPLAPAMPHPEDLDAALADMGEAFDVSREDLEALFVRVRHHQTARVASSRASPRGGWRRAP